MRNKAEDLKKPVSNHVGSSSPSTSAETAMRNKARRVPDGAILPPRWLSPSKATMRNKVEERGKRLQDHVGRGTRDGAAMRNKAENLGTVLSHVGCASSSSHRAAMRNKAENWNCS
ncbi:hypothetical protein VE00_01962 [Pseudogymnoascus sp. WSF 3629]|nr:hypothetical protein VE00_01962 [Pseudogymnoascus sp. WSF 3629]